MKTVKRLDLAWNFRCVSQTKSSLCIILDHISHWFPPVFTSPSFSLTRYSKSLWCAINQVEGIKGTNSGVGTREWSTATTLQCIRRKNQWFDFRVRNTRRITDSTTNLSAMLLTDEAQNLCGYLADTREITDRYNNCIHKMKTIVTEIENKYHIGK